MKTTYYSGDELYPVGDRRNAKRLFPPAEDHSTPPRELTPEEWAEIDRKRAEFEAAWKATIAKYDRP
jgi:hypothetical protein